MDAFTTIYLALAALRFVLQPANWLLKRYMVVSARTQRILKRVEKFAAWLQILFAGLKSL